MAARRRVKASSSKKEKLLGAELGKTGRAAERGKPVTNAQKGLGNYSRQTMQNKRMRDMPVKQKVSQMGLQLTVGAAVSPGTLRAVTRGAGRVASAASKTGVPARISNAVTGKKVVVHGSPTQAIRSIEPRSGSNASPTQKVAYGWNPAAKGSKNFVAQNAQTYAGGSGSIYVAKGPKLSSKYEKGFDKAITKSTSPLKVVKEIPVKGKSQKQLRDEISDAVRRAGSPLRSAAKSKSKTPAPKTRRF